MSRLRIAFLMGMVAVFVLLLTSISTRAQTASTSTVTGTVSDTTGSTVPNAKVDLEDVDTKATTSTTTGSDGGYTFPSLRPGNYSITVSSKGFRQSVVSGVRVAIGKSALVNVILEVGGLTETVEVNASTGIELQTMDASVGDVLDSNLLANLPTLSRDATSLMLLQPMAIPGFNGAVSGSGDGNSSGGTIAGARMDQNTFNGGRRRLQYRLPGYAPSGSTHPRRKPGRVPGANEQRRCGLYTVTWRPGADGHAAGVQRLARRRLLVPPK